MDKKNKIENATDNIAANNTESTEESVISVSAEDIQENGEIDDNTALAATENTNTHLRRLISSNYIEYASYVIKERAIPDINDGMKPVQRRILWSMYRMEDGKFNKVANIVGHTMQYHPHGDASIYMALVNLANKEYFIEKQGNFGNILTGDAPAAARYIEARLTPLGKEVLFNPDITDFVDSYDGRNKEPIFLPAKVPALLMTGQEGIAPGMTTKILPHNFKELLEAQIAVLRNKSFELFPDFLQGGIMDVSEYEDGNGKVTVRAKIDVEGRKLIIREIPAMTTTENLISSIEKAVAKNKIKLASIDDYTGEKIEIEIVPARGYKPEKILKLLYAYTDCSLSVSSSLLVIRENRPVVMTVSDILKHNTECLVEYLRMELQIEMDKLNERYHEKTLEQIFIENRIYKRIEECKTYGLVLEEVRKGLNKFKNLLKREITDKDIERLLAIPIRRISRFDMDKNKKDIADILKAIKATEENLNSIVKYTIDYIKSLIKRFAADYPRRTEIEKFEKVDKRVAALNNIKVGWERKSCYIGTSIRSEEMVTCNEYDHLHCIEKKGKYRIISIPQKMYIGRLYYFNKYNKNTVFSIVYKDKKKNVYYAKRCVVDKFIRDKEYRIIPSGCQLELLTTRDNTVYDCLLEKTPRQKKDSLELDFSKIGMRSPAVRGFRFTDKKILKFRFKGQTEEIDPPDETFDDEPTPQTDTETIKETVENKIHESTVDVPDETKKAPIADIKPQKEDKISSKTEERKKPISQAKKQEKENEKSETPKEEKSDKKTKPKTVIKKPEPASPPKATTTPQKNKITATTSKSEKTVEKKTPPPPSTETNKNPDDEDDWGIVQPDLGF